MLSNKSVAINLKELMTRINLVDPSELADQHLFAEYRELPRIFTLVLAAQQRGLTPDTAKIPAQYVLGAGHVTFFYNKVYWLTDRFQALIAECLHRGFNIQRQNIPAEAERIQASWWGNYMPTPQAIALSQSRIAEKIAMKPTWYRWSNKVVPCVTNKASC